MIVNFLIPRKKNAKVLSKTEQMKNCCELLVFFYFCELANWFHCSVSYLFLL